MSRTSSRFPAGMTTRKAKAMTDLTQQKPATVPRQPSIIPASAGILNRRSVFGGWRGSSPYRFWQSKVLRILAREVILSPQRVLSRFARVLTNPTLRIGGMLGKVDEALLMFALDPKPDDVFTNFYGHLFFGHPASIAYFLARSVQFGTSLVNPGIAAI
jgi:hypothetical protein